MFLAQIQRNTYAIAFATILFISQASSWSEDVASVTASDVGDNSASDAFDIENIELRDADASAVVDATETDDLSLEAANNSSFNTAESRSDQAFGK